MLLALAASALAQVAVKVDLPDTATLGEPIVARVTLGNDTDRVQYVPADWEDKLRARAEHHLPRSRIDTVHRMPVSVDVDADKVDWVAIAPWGAQTFDVPLVESAHAGTYTIKLATPHTRLAEEQADHDLAHLLHEQRITVDPALDAVSLPLTVRDARLEDGALVFTAVIRNPGDAPTWVPQAFFPQCQVAAWVKGEPIGVGTMTGGGGQPPIFDEPHLTLLAPEGEATHEVSCGTLPDKATVISATVELTLPSPVIPVLPDSPRRVQGEHLRSTLWMGHAKDL